MKDHFSQLKNGVDVVLTDGTLSHSGHIHLEPHHVLHVSFLNKCKKLVFFFTCFAIIEDIFEINRGINSEKKMEGKYLFKDLLDISVCPL